MCVGKAGLIQTPGWGVWPQPCPRSQSLRDMAKGYLLYIGICVCISECIFLKTKAISEELTAVSEEGSSRIINNDKDGKIINMSFNDIQSNKEGNIRIINKNTETKSEDSTFNVVQLNAENLEEHQRDLQLPTSIEVKSDSILYTQPEQPAVIKFEVTNNLYSPILYSFYANSEERILQIQPQRAYISPRSSRIIEVIITPDGRSERGQVNSDIVTFSARWSTIPFRYESVSKKVYIHSGYQAPDSSNPSISYTYNGDCGGFFEPNNCEERKWRADITVQDSESGLLMLKSLPVGLILNNEFIVGTTKEIKGSYTSNCCLTKVDIIARDVYGNERTLSIDVERIWLSTGEIIAIVLGSILLLILIVLIILCIIRLCKKRRSLSIYPDSRPL